MNFKNKLSSIIKKNNSLLCIGLDPVLEKIPSFLQNIPDPIFNFNKEIIDATFDLVCAYKPNIAFYEAYGIEGLKSLKKTIEYLIKKYPQIPIVLDAKRADIGNTAKMYAKAAFEYWQSDSVTVYPYLGLDSLTPFFDYKDNYTILLIKTSNPDSKTFQDQQINGEPFYMKIAREIKKWKIENIGLFVGATYPDELAKVRQLFPDTPILTAGLGTQGAKTEKAVKAGIDKDGGNLICNNSREIIYAGNDEDFASFSRKRAEEIKNIINQYRL